MFLKALTPRADAERGSALVAVLGLLGVVMVVSLAVSTVTVRSMGATTASRAGVQAEAAAEAGVDYAAANLSKGACLPTYSQSTAPTFSVAVSFSMQSTGDTWVNGCPSGVAAQRLRTVSTGHAAASGVAGDSSGNVRSVEAIYPAVVANGQVMPSGPAVYAYSSAGFSGSGTVLGVSGTIPSVKIKTGDVVCNGGSNVAGDLVAARGTLTIGGSCSVNGNVWSSGAMTISGGDITVGGNATAPSMNLSGVEVKGNAWASGVMTLTWGTTVDQNATAATLNLSGGDVKGSAWASGTATYAGGASIHGHLTARSASSTTSAAGGTTIVPSGPGAGPAPGATPVVPDWIDVGYNPATWVGFAVRTVSGTCDWAALQNAATLLAGGPGIVDARGCTAPISISDNQKLTLGNDLAIFANGFNLGGSTGFASSSKHRLWLITPDSTPDGAPSPTTCTSSMRTIVGGGVTLDPNLSVMIYSPCQVNIGSGINWTGQIFAGSVTISGAAKLNYVRVGMPGFDLDNGTASNPTDPTASLIGTRISIRDVLGAP